MDNRILEIMKHFPDGNDISFVYYLLDSIVDGDTFGIEDIVIDFCKDIKEKEYWKDSFPSFKFLFTAAVLKYYSAKWPVLRPRYESFTNRYFGKIAIERDLFFQKNSPKGKPTVNITDYLYTDPVFALINHTDENSIQEKSSDSSIRVLKKLLSRAESASEGKTGEYGIDYEYQTSTGERLDYKSIPGAKLTSSSMNHTSSLFFLLEGYSNVVNVISFCRTVFGYVYIVESEGHYFIRSQGFSQTSRLIRKGKTPVYVKASGARVIVLMSDGTLTSNFEFDLSGIKEAWFDQNCELKTKLL